MDNTLYNLNPDKQGDIEADEDPFEPVFEDDD